MLGLFAVEGCGSPDAPLTFLSDERSDAGVKTTKKPPELAAISLLFNNDPGGFRTHDLRIKSPLLYQLSYRVLPALKIQRSIH